MSGKVSQVADTIGGKAAHGGAGPQSTDDWDYRSKHGFGVGELRCQ